MYGQELTKEQQILLLVHFIKENPPARELKRALAVKLVLEGKSYREIQDILVVSVGFISESVSRFELGGIEGMRSKYRGSKSYLTAEEKAEIIEWIKSQNGLDITELECYIAEKYDVVFKSIQSYYQILKEAGISWQKGKKVNPKQDPEKVNEKNQEIAKILEENREEIEAEKLVVYTIDECHLRYEDVCGYGWNIEGKPIEFPIDDYNARQTYYGALNIVTGDFILQEHKAGNGENTIDFIKELQKLNPSARLLIIWDGASYHSSEDFRKFLDEENKDLEINQWKITCIKMAPYAPKENPVEAIWLQLKTLLRRFRRFAKKFGIVKRMFKMFVKFKLFNLPDLKKYDAFSQFI